MIIKTQQKAAQETEIDHLLAEEFTCDATFGERFLEACGFSGTGYKVDSVYPEPSLGGEGFGDLLVEGRISEQRIALLIEDKITAGPTLRQAERYAAQAARMRDQGWHKVYTILAAPSSYTGERDQYDAAIELETIASLLRSSDQNRLVYRRQIIARAIKKKASSGVRIPDEAMHRLRSDYFEYVSAWCEKNDCPLQFPKLRESYYDGASWIENIGHARLPDTVKLRHRLWVSVNSDLGQVDLIAVQPDEAIRKRFDESAPQGSVVSTFSNGKGIQVSLDLPKMNQRMEFNSEIVEQALLHMKMLVDWYLDGK